MSTMMTFEYLSQLCQNKEQVLLQPGGLKDSRGEEAHFRSRRTKKPHKPFSAFICYSVVGTGDYTVGTELLNCFVSAAEAVVSEDGIHMVPFQFDLIQLLPKCQQVELFFLTFSTGIVLTASASCNQRARVTEFLFYFFQAVQPEEQPHSASCLPNELLLNLLHHSLEQELNDREIPLAYSDHSAFMHHILERERDGNTAPFSLPVIKGQHISQPAPIMCFCKYLQISAVLFCFDRGVCKARRQAGQYDIISH